MRIPGFSLLLAVGLLTANFASAQNKLAGQPLPPDSVYDQAEVMPAFPGGQEELYQYLSASLNYPDEYRKKDIQGVVYARFTVDGKGKVRDIKILKQVKDAPLFNDEVIRVISAMPEWTPGINNGQNVAVTMVLPVRFSLQ